MSKGQRASILEQTKSRFREIADKNDLLSEKVSVLAKPLTPEEAIGTPGRRDFPITTGKERILESRVLGARGHAFTDSPREFMGTIEAVLNRELNTNQNRAIYVATLNAALAYLKMVDATVHCKDDEPEKCAIEITRHLLKKHGKVYVGLIGLNPAIGEQLVETFGKDHVRISDLNSDNIGKLFSGVEILDGGTQAEDLIDTSDLVLLTGTTLVNGTFDHIWNRIQIAGKNSLVYGVTAAGISKLIGFERICPCGQIGTE